MSLTKLFTPSLVLLLAACSSTAPIVDTKGVDMDQYAVDLEECKAYQQQVKSKWKEDAVGGVLLGGLLGAIDGDPVGGAAAGGLLGGAGAEAEAADKEDKVIRQCLRQRGYRVLD